jgi:hypothetical protein
MYDLAFDLIALPDFNALIGTCIKKLKLRMDLMYLKYEETNFRVFRVGDDVYILVRGLGDQTTDDNAP